MLCKVTHLAAKFVKKSLHGVPRPHPAFKSHAVHKVGTAWHKVSTSLQWPALHYRTGNLYRCTDFWDSYAHIWTAKVFSIKHQRVYLTAPCGDYSNITGSLHSHGLSIASYPGPAQLSVACSTEKQGETGIFSHVNMTQSENGKNLPNRLCFVYFQPTTHSTLGV